MKKTIKVISVLMLVLIMVSVVTPVFATETSISEMIGDVKPNAGDLTGKDSKLGTTLNKVLGVLQYVGMFAAVAILMIIGIKYMMGSAEEKAEYKKTLIPYILGAVLLFAASFIVGVIANASDTFIK